VISEASKKAYQMPQSTASETKAPERAKLPW
jgi:hypothetical protein